MKLILIGGHSRNVGKTSVVAGIISSLSEFNWTALKITQFGHGVCSINGDACGCSTGEHQYVITSERLADSGTDSSRFLAAGARRALWVRTKAGELATALPALKNSLAQDEYVIAESNSLRRFWQPTLYLQVLDPLNPDFKLSAQQFFDLSDGYILVANSESPDTVDAALHAWQQISLARELKKAKPYFIVNRNERFISTELIDFVKLRL